MKDRLTGCGLIASQPQLNFWATDNYKCRETIKMILLRDRDNHLYACKIIILKYHFGLYILS